MFVLKISGKEKILFIFRIDFNGFYTNAVDQFKASTPQPDSDSNT